MLPAPQQLSGIDVNVRRFNNQLQKEFARQALRNKSTQSIRLRPLSYGMLADWMKKLCDNKTDRNYIIECVNEQLEGSGWQITGHAVEKDNGYPNALRAVLKYRAERDEGLDMEAFAA